MPDLIVYAEGFCGVNGVSHYPVPFEVRDCGKYGLQLYLYRYDRLDRYSMREIVDSLYVGSRQYPRTLPLRLAYRTDRQGD
jgi:hypothetical protein